MSYNKVICMGRLTRDPDLRTIPAGTPVSELGIAMDSGWGDKKTTCFIDVTVWGKQAEFVDKYFKKGDGIHIEGRLDLDQWEDKETMKKRSKHRITAERVTFPIGSKGGGDNAVQNNDSDSKPSGKESWNAQQSERDIPF